ncbi:hypothetical protein [Streptomyces sp. NPDC047043]|uniref:hypothetical protein n=1 Tax=Streptomyces sp. NPDC047043 TaxID=3154497 RepID=UPI0033F99F33
MSKPAEYDPESGGPEDPPNVYHPRGASSPAYEAYADPAAAHGWLSAYDETRELPSVADGTGRSAEPGGVRQHRRSRRKPSAWRSRHAAVAAGAVGAVSAMAAAVALSFSGSPSGSPSDGVQGKDRRTSPTAGDSAGATAPASSGGVAADPSPERSGTASPSPSGSTSPSASKGGDGSPRSSAPTTATATPAPTATTGNDGRGNANGNPGHGQGGTKGPK